MRNYPDLGILIFFLVCVWGGGRKEEGGHGMAWHGRAGHGDVLAGEWKQLFSNVTHCINLIQIALNFHQDIP